MIWLALVLAALSALILAVMAVQMQGAVRRLPRLARTAEPLPEGEIVSVVIPAYNEEAIIESTVRALLDATPSSSLEVIVVDDRSTDATADKIRAMAEQDPRLRLLPGAPRPDDQILLGKNWACWQGSKEARGKYLLFVDADFTVKPGCIEAALALSRAQGAGLLGVMPEKALALECEWMVEPQLTILHLVGPWLADTPDPDKRRAFTPGWFMLFERDTYEKIGGHWSVRGKVLEDLALGERTKATGSKVVFALAPEVSEMHLYDSWAEMVEGYTKNFFCGMEHSIPTALASSLFMLLLYCVPWLGAATALATLGRGGWPWDALAASSVAGIVLQLVLRLQLRSAVGISLRRFAWVPIGGLLLAWLNVLSMVRHLRGQVTWKGIPIADH
jgi:glycosyltransferase involved in cell wall biosynthesis